MNCQWMYKQIDGVCVHYVWPLSFENIVGSLMICMVGGFSIMAGIGGGATQISLLMAGFNYAPKDATFVVFPCILGASMGNIINQGTKSMNQQPLIQFKYAYAALPIMFTGALIGAFLNVLLPSIVIVGLLIYGVCLSVSRVYVKFIQSYRRQTEQNLLHQGKQIIKDERMNPFLIQDNIFIFKTISKLIIFYLIMLAIRGSDKFQSMIGIHPCSFSYWLIYLLTFLGTVWVSKINLHNLMVWLSPKSTNLDQTLIESNNDLYHQSKVIIQYSLLAGVFSGFGIGGGMYLVPMYRQLKLNSVQATSTCNFCIFVGSIINCLQGVFFGLIRMPDLIFFLSLTFFGGFLVSKILSQYLMKINRLSLVQGLFIILSIFGGTNIPLSLWKKYVSSGYNLDTIFGFGNFC